MLCFISFLFVYVVFYQLFICLCCVFYAFGVKVPSMKPPSSG